MGRGNALWPAAWLDDRTLLAISGPLGGVNALLRVEIDDTGELRGYPALPVSDWSHRAVAVHPDAGSFVTVAVRDDRRMLFCQETDATASDEPTVMEQPEVPDDAHLVAWLASDTATSTADVCGSR